MPPKNSSNELIEGQAKRALQVGSLATFIGGSYAWQTLKPPVQFGGDKEPKLPDPHLKNALRIVESSRELRGAFMKLIQKLSMLSDIFPTEVLGVLSVVQASVPPTDYDLIGTQVKKAWPRSGTLVQAF